MVRIGFDPIEDAIQVSRHGLSLARAVELEWDAVLVWIDDRQAYGEERMIALAPIATTRCFVAFADRSQTRRFISLRRANRREVKHCVKVTEEDSD